MLRAAVLHPFLRGIRRFSTSGHPEALDACYVASWQLPRPDSHRQANDDFQGTPCRCSARNLSKPPTLRCDGPGHSALPDALSRPVKDAALAAVGLHARPPPPTPLPP